MFQIITHPSVIIGRSGGVFDEVESQFRGKIPMMPNFDIFLHEITDKVKQHMRSTGEIYSMVSTENRRSRTIAPIFEKRKEEIRPSLGQSPRR